MDFAKGERVKLKHWGDTATVVALPDEVEAAEGLKGHFRIKLDDAAKGWRYVTPDKLVRVEAKQSPKNHPAEFSIYENGYVLNTEVWGWTDSPHIILGITNEDYTSTSARLTEAEAEALVAELQHALAELALGE